MQLFYNPILNPNNKEFSFSKEESRHIVKVLRKKENDVLTITDGKDNLYQVKLVLANEKNCCAEIIKIEHIVKPWDYHLHIAIAPTKNNDRLEWFLEKATEIGIDEITPIICQNSERKIIKTERLQKIIEAAMKQSLKYRLPKLNNSIKFNDFIKQEFSGLTMIAHCNEGSKTKLKEIKTKEKYTILIGPEGDFSIEEVQKALAKRFTPISLGESRLRTETAGIVATHSISLLR